MTIPIISPWFTSHLQLSRAFLIHRAPHPSPRRRVAMGSGVSAEMLANSSQEEVPNAWTEQKPSFDGWTGDLIGILMVI